MIRCHLNIALLVVCFAGCQYTEDDYVRDWMDLYCEESIEKCDGGDYYTCGLSPMDCCLRAYEEEAGDQSVGEYFLEGCPAYDGKEAKACLEAWQQIVDENECLDNTGSAGITDPPECEDVCIPSLG